MGKKGKCKTQIKKRTLNPEFNEVCKRAQRETAVNINELLHKLPTHYCGLTLSNHRLYIKDWCRHYDFTRWFVKSDRTKSRFVSEHHMLPGIHLAQKPRTMLIWTIATCQSQSYYVLHHILLYASFNHCTLITIIIYLRLVIGTK